MVGELSRVPRRCHADFPIPRERSMLQFLLEGMQTAFHFPA